MGVFCGLQGGGCHIYSPCVMKMAWILRCIEGTPIYVQGMCNEMSVNEDIFLYRSCDVKLTKLEHTGNPFSQGQNANNDHAMREQSQFVHYNQCSNCRNNNCNHTCVAETIYGILRFQMGTAQWYRTYVYNHNARGVSLPARSINISFKGWITSAS